MRFGTSGQIDPIDAGSLRGDKIKTLCPFGQGCAYECIIHYTRCGGIYLLVESRADGTDNGVMLLAYTQVAVGGGLNPIFGCLVGSKVYDCSRVAQLHAHDITREAIGGFDVGIFDYAVAWAASRKESAEGKNSNGKGCNRKKVSS